MRENRVLYQVKSLDKMITRYCLGNVDTNSDLENIKFYLTPTQMQIIEYILKHYDEEIYQKDLEAILNLRRATVSGVLQTMEKNGLLERVGYLQDARVKKIILNDKAKEIFSQKQKELENIEKIITSNISNEEIEIFSNVLNKMKNNLLNIK